MQILVLSVKKAEIITLIDSTNGINVLEVKILLRGGERIWDDEDNSSNTREQIINDYLIPNEIPFRDIWKGSEEYSWIVLADENKLKWDDFYTTNDLEENNYDEDENNMLCWKCIYMFITVDGNDFLGNNIVYFNNNSVNKLCNEGILKIINQYIKST